MASRDAACLIVAVGRKGFVEVSWRNAQVVVNVLGNQWRLIESCDRWRSMAVVVDVESKGGLLAGCRASVNFESISGAQAD